MKVSLTKFQHMARDFVHSLPTMNIVQMDSAFKDLSHAYHNLNCNNNNQPLADISLNIATQRFMTRDLECQLFSVSKY